MFGWCSLVLCERSSPGVEAGQEACLAEVAHRGGVVVELHPDKVHGGQGGWGDGHVREGALRSAGDVVGLGGICGV